jgi:hypothetical protein
MGHTRSALRCHHHPARGRRAAPSGSSSQSFLGRGPRVRQTKVCGHWLRTRYALACPAAPWPTALRQHGILANQSETSLVAVAWSVFPYSLVDSWSFGNQAGNVPSRAYISSSSLLMRSNARARVVSSNSMACRALPSVRSAISLAA